MYPNQNLVLTFTNLNPPYANDKLFYKFGESWIESTASAAAETAIQPRAIENNGVKALGYEITNV